MPDIEKILLRLIEVKLIQPPKGIANVPLGKIVNWHLQMFSGVKTRTGKIVRVTDIQNGIIITEFLGETKGRTLHLSDEDLKILGL